MNNSEKLKFSERIGITKSQKIIQIDFMNASLRNSIWNYLLKSFFSGSYDQCESAITTLCEKYFKIPLDTLPKYRDQLKNWLKDRFYKFQWFEVYNLIEFIFQNLEEMFYLHDSGVFKTNINAILEEEISGYRFISEVLTPISNDMELQSIEKTISSSKQYNFEGIYTHIETAIQLLSKRPTPDYRNSIKESISAVESLVKYITNEESGGLEKAFKKLEEKIEFHGGFKSGLLSLYGYTSDEDGIRHAILEESRIDFDDAKFMLVSCSALINFIIAKASKSGLIK